MLTLYSNKMSEVSASNHSKNSIKQLCKFKRALQFVLIASLSFSLTLFINEATFSLPLPQETQPSEVEKSEVDVPVCYMQTGNGRILPLGRLCEKQPVDSDIRSAPPSPSPYDASAIEKFDEELYGKGN